MRAAAATVQIKAVKDLPRWFVGRKYRKRLSPEAWYREVRHRQFLSQLSKGRLGTSKIDLLRLLTNDPPRTSPYDVEANEGEPVRDLQVGEVVLCRYAVSGYKANEACVRLEKLLNRWMRVLLAIGSESPGKTRKLLDYERALQSFWDETPLDELAHLRHPITIFNERMENPFLYRPALNG